MTNAKSPIEQAVAALEKALKVGGLCEPGCEGRCIACPQDCVTEALSALRAQPGKMTAAEEWYCETPAFTSPKEPWLKLFKRIQADALAAHPEPRPLEESGWLVELKGNTPKWWCYKFPSSEEEAPDWTSDASKAIRFARQCDAQAVIDYYGWTEAFASEHAWHGTWHTVTPHG